MKYAGLVAGLIVGSVVCLVIPGSSFSAPHACMPCHEGKFTSRYSHYPALAGRCTICHEAKPEHLSGQQPPILCNRIGLQLYTFTY